MESICDSINIDRIETRLEELNADPCLACAILKKFLRELKSHLVADEIIAVMDKCDANISDKEFSTKIEYLKKIFNKMALPNRDTFAYIIMHFHRVFSKHEINKIECGILVQKFQPFFRIRERLFKFIIYNADVLFSEYRFKKYKYKTNDETMSRISMMPENIEDLELEISKQEAYLANLHKRIANEEHSNDKMSQEQLSDELWALQRYVTSLKRKVKKLKLERKLIEAEQLNDAKIGGPNQVTTSSSNSTIKNEDINDPKTDTNISSTNANISDYENQQALSINNNQEQMLNPIELLAKESSLLCENNVLIETCKIIFLDYNVLY